MSLYKRTLERFARTSMGYWYVTAVAPHIDPPLLKATGGRISSVYPVPAMLLTTVGAKTGLARTTSLTYAKDGDAYLVVASKGGEPTAPGWYFNLKAKPEIEINVGPKRLPVTARVVGKDDPDYARLWQVVNKNNANRYAGYQKRTTRPIPVVALTPR